jgi:hypothetical protein
MVFFIQGVQLMELRTFTQMQAGPLLFRFVLSIFSENPVSLYNFNVYLWTGIRLYWAKLLQEEDSRPGAHKFSENLTLISKFYASEEWHEASSINIRRHRKKCSRDGNLPSGNCTPLPWNTCSVVWWLDPGYGGGMFLRNVGIYT